VIESVLPAAVATAVAYGDVAQPDDHLFAAEQELVAKAVAQRQREFTTVRHLARRALRQLGLPAVPILPNGRGAPQWPRGVVGSMTHCAGYRAAAVAPAEVSAAVSIDAEPNGPLPDGVLETVTLPSERARLRALVHHRPDVRWDRMYFSAKESVFKAWYPLTGRELDFPEAEIHIDPGAGTFTARLLVPGPVIAGRRVLIFPGRWHMADGLLATAIHLPAPSSPARLDSDRPSSRDSSTEFAHKSPCPEGE
jgi:4'-phosphopantetheinyl transferase EntD